MRLRAFNLEKEKNRIGNSDNKKYIITAVILTFLILMSVIIYQSYALYKTKSSNTIVESLIGTFKNSDIKISVWIDDEKQADGVNFPTDKNFVDVTCTTGDAVWNNDNANLTIKDITKQTDCNVYFISKDLLKNTIISDNGGEEEIINRGNPDFSKISPVIQKYADISFNDQIYYNNLLPETYTLGSSYTFDETTGKYQLSGTIVKGLAAAQDGYYTLKNNSETYSHATIYKIEKIIDNTHCDYTYKLGTSNPIYSQDQGLYKTRSDAYFEENNFGQFASQDDNDGPSYYFRGDVKNNYVVFAGFWWRIVRINGNGTIRLIYNGLDSTSTGETTNISTSMFNLNGNNNINMGYMYGLDTTTYATTHTNELDSTIKEVLETWYEENIANQPSKVVNKIANEIFCGDRNIRSGDKGYATNVTWYGARERIYTNKKPSLQCKNKTGQVLENNDQYSALGASKGNGTLKYPVGLLNADEVVFAGGGTSANAKYWLNTGESYWLLSPNYFNIGYAYIWFVQPAGTLFNNSSKLVHGVRPVINLKANTSVSGGNGTIDNPYIINVN